MAVLTISVFTTWWSFITYTVTIWMVGWILLGIAAMVFPYVRKDIFEKSPQLVQSRVLGVPWITILGILTIVAAVTVYATFLRGTTPTFNTKNLALDLALLHSCPDRHLQHFEDIPESKGIGMDLRFKTVPPD